MSARRELRNAEREWRCTPVLPVTVPKPKREPWWLVALWVVGGTAATAWLAGWF